MTPTPLAIAADVTQLETLRPWIAGRECVVVGSAPLKTSKVLVSTGEYVIAINGAISSVKGSVDLWMLNSKLQDKNAREWPMKPLHRSMLQQGAGRKVQHVALLRGPKHATEAFTLGHLTGIGCEYLSWSVIDKPTKLWFEQHYCGRKCIDEPCSAGLFTAALALWCQAATVRLVGVSFAPGYHYMKGAGYRGHVEADKRAVKVLSRQFGTRFDAGGLA